MSPLADFMTTEPAHRLLVIKTAADHASLLTKVSSGKTGERPLSFILPGCRVACLVGIFNGSHVAVIAAWLHDLYEDCSQEWILKTDALIAGILLPEEERQDIAAIVEALTKKKTITAKADRLSDSLDRILNAPPDATLVKLCDRIDNLLDSADRNGGFTKRYLASTDEVLEKLSMRASLCRYDAAIDILVQIRNSNLKKL